MLYAYGKVLPGMPCYFLLTYFIFCYALLSLLRAKCCANALRALSLSLTFFYDFKEVSLGLVCFLSWILTSELHHLIVAARRLLSYQSSPTGLEVFLTQKHLAFYVLLIFPLLPLHKHFNFTSKLCFSVNFDGWFTCFMVKIVLQI